jgi:hypothetical protein
MIDFNGDEKENRVVCEFKDCVIAEATVAHNFYKGKKEFKDLLYYFMFEEECAYV